MDAAGSGIVFIRRFSRETNGKLERLYGVYDQKQHQFRSIEKYVHWHNEINPHISLNYDTPIQVFQKKLPLEKTETIRTIQDAKLFLEMRGALRISNAFIIDRRIEGYANLA